MTHAPNTLFERRPRPWHKGRDGHWYDVNHRFIATDDDMAIHVINADAPQPFKKGLYQLKDPAQKDRFYADWITDELGAAEVRKRGYIIGKFIGSEFEP